MRLPQHVTIIPDGDRRWAKMNQVDDVKGYLAGMTVLENTVKAARAHNIPYVSFWVFSHDNMRRPTAWQKMFFGLLQQYLKIKCQSMFDQNVGVKIVGDWESLEDVSKGLAEQILWIHEHSPKNPAMTVMFLLNYTGKRDIQQAVEQCMAHHDTIDNLPQYLQTRLAGFPDPELLIRTSNVRRLSDYMIYQCANTELFFVDKLWPDFTEQDLDAALSWFSETEQRCGA